MHISKGNYRLIAVDLNFRYWTQQIVLQGVFEGDDGTKIRLYIVLRKSKETVLEFYKRIAKVVWIIWMVEYSKVNVNVSNSQLHQLKTAAKNKKGVTLRMNIKKFNGNNLPHELLFTAR